MTALAIGAYAVSQIDQAVRGIHVLWAGPLAWAYSPTGYIIERRAEIPRPQWQCAILDGLALARLRQEAEIASPIGPVRLHAAAPPASLTSGAVPVPGAWEAIDVDLDAPADAIRVMFAAKWAQVIAFARGKAVAATPLSKNGITVELSAPGIDAVTVLLAGGGEGRICADRPAAWEAATRVAELQLPLVELDPALGGPAGELALARSRLLAGETMDAAELAEGLELVRALVAGRTARPIDHTLLLRDEDVDGQPAQPIELGGLDPLRTLLSSPRWRRALGLAWFDGDPALVVGQRYQYRVRAAFPAIDDSDRVFGFHTVPTATILPCEVALGGAQIRLGQPSSVLLADPPSAPGVSVSRRGIRLEDAGTAGPWWAPDLADWGMVVDLPAPARSVTLELAGSHALRLWAGSGDAVVSDATVPPGPSPRVDLSSPVDQLRLRGSGFLCALRTRAAAPTVAEVEIAGSTPAVLFDTTAPPPPPLAMTASNIAPPGARGPSVLGFDASWVAPPAGDVDAWPPDLPPPPTDAAFYQLERRAEPSGPWLPVLDGDNLVAGRRDLPPLPAVLSPGADILEVFPEWPPPGAPILSVRWVDTFAPLEPADRPQPGTWHRYRVRSVDGIGRASASWTTGDPVRLEKNRPPPQPGGFSARALVAGAPDLTADDRALLAGHASALVIRCRWGDEERALDPFARELRFYAGRLRVDAIAGAITAVTPLGPGEFRVSWQLDEPVQADEAAGLRLAAPYPFLIVHHTAGSVIDVDLKAAVPDGSGSYPVPAPGAAWLPVPAGPLRRRPERFGARAAVQSIDARTDYVAVLHDLFWLDATHPVDRLLAGVSAADDQPYVSDVLAPLDNRPGNEGALAMTLVTARDQSRPVLAEAAAIAPVARIETPVPRGDDLRAAIDLSPLLAGLSLPSGPIRLERAGESAILRAYRVEGDDVIAMSPEPSRAEEVATPLAIANAGDRAAIRAGLLAADSAGLDDRYLVFLAAAHPYRARLFQLAVARAALPVIDDTWPPHTARWVYRVRALDDAGRASADGRTLHGVVRVPPAVAPRAPERRLVAVPSELELRFPDSGVARLLVFSVDASADGRPSLVALAGRTDGVTHALRLADGALVLPERDIAAQAATADGDERVAVVTPSAPPGQVRRVWACTVSPSGVASPLAGPWLWRMPSAAPPVPALTVTRTSDRLRADWIWPAGLAEVPPVFVEAGAAGGELARVSPRLGAATTSFELPAAGVAQVRLVVRGADGALLRGPVSEGPWA